MSDPLAFDGASGPRRVWVFALDTEVAGPLARWREPAEDGSWPLPTALGEVRPDPAHVEVFAAGELADYGLDRYLTEANGMDPDAVAADRERLGALDGGVVVVFSRGLTGQAGRFAPVAPLAFVGTYAEKPSLVPPSPIAPIDAARGTLMPGNTPPPAASTGRHPWFILIAALAITCAVAALVWSLA